MELFLFIKDICCLPAIVFFDTLDGDSFWRLKGDALTTDSITISIELESACTEGRPGGFSLGCGDKLWKTCSGLLVLLRLSLGGSSFSSSDASGICLFELLLCLCPKPGLLVILLLSDIQFVHIKQCPFNFKFNFILLGASTIESMS